MLPANASAERLAELRAAKLAGFYVADSRLYCGARRGRPMPEHDRLVIPQSLVPTVLAGEWADRGPQTVDGSIRACVRAAAASPRNPHSEALLHAAGLMG